VRQIDLSCAGSGATYSARTQDSTGLLSRSSSTGTDGRFKPLLSPEARGSQAGPDVNARSSVRHGMSSLVMSCRLGCLECRSASWGVGAEPGTGTETIAPIPQRAPVSAPRDRAAGCAELRPLTRNLQALTYP